MHFLCIFMLIHTAVKAQISENFNFRYFSNSAWSGDTASFFVNANAQLQTIDSAENKTFSIASENHLCVGVQWEAWIRLSFNPSSVNYVDFYLTSSLQQFNSNQAKGYFVRIGNTQDEISLYRRDKDGLIEKIIDGEDGTLNHSSNICKIKVIHDASGKWLLYRDLSGTGNSWYNEGAAMDTTYTTSAWSGVGIKQSSPSFFGKHFIDDIEIKTYEPDTSAPKIISAVAISPVKIDVLFDEPVDISSQGFSNYSVNNIGMPETVSPDLQNPSLVHLVFSNSFTNGYAYTLTVNGIKDLQGNVITQATTPFSSYNAQRNDVVFDEIFADPTPSMGLPDFEWIEIKNNCSFPLNLSGWKISDGSTEAFLPSILLQPDSFLVVCSSSAAGALAQYGNAVGISGFPSLDNEGEILSLFDQNGKTIHAVQYSSGWHQNELKKSGGWSLEMIDTKNPCNTATNWKSSQSPNGGTPAKKNSVDGINADNSNPKLLGAFANNDKTITLIFDEPVDSLQAGSFHNFIFDNNLSAIDAVAIPPLFTKVNVTLNNATISEKIYTVSAQNISDCAGNIIAANNSARFGLPQKADSFDIVINEILFNPLEDGVDYVELYNRSGKIIDLSKVSIANRNSSSTVSSITPMSAQPILFFPKDFLVITTDPSIVKSQYVMANADAFIKATSLPSFSNDKGNVIILNNQGSIIDEVAYSDKWHFPLMQNTKGVSLERINYDAPSVQNNFHSAASSAGYGTPGYKNSQFFSGDDFRATITVTPSIFSPDNDGNEDFATINYNFPSAGYVANITIFDASGRPVRFLEKNSLSGLTGYFRWDGLDDKGKKLPQGIYIIFTEIFNKDGRKKQFKNTVVLARKSY